jgi:hypothetical protein
MHLIFPFLQEMEAMLLQICVVYKHFHSYYFVLLETYIAFVLSL